MVILIASAFREVVVRRRGGGDPTGEEQEDGGGGATATDVVDGTKADAESGPVQERRQISAAVLEIPAMSFIFNS